MLENSSIRHRPPEVAKAKRSNTLSVKPLFKDTHQVLLATCLFSGSISLGKAIFPTRAASAMSFALDKISVKLPQCFSLDALFSRLATSEDLHVYARRFESKHIRPDFVPGTQLLRVLPLSSCFAQGLSVKTSIILCYEVAETRK